MIKEDLGIKEEYFQLSKSIMKTLLDGSQLPKSKMVVTICGESGSGKFVTAMCLVKTLQEKGFNAIVLNQDGFFHLPPMENSAKRNSEISWVGPQEVDLESMQSVIDDFKNGKSVLNIRIVDYRENEISEEQLNVNDIDVLVVEGTYAFLLEGTDTKIFI
ncbi:MAG: uridine kinase [Saprospiraceae bacterium]